MRQLHPTAFRVESTSLCVALCVASVGLAACAGQRMAEDSATDAEVASEPLAEVSYVSIYQGACFGTCPVYTLAIDGEGAADYDGKQFAPYQGLHHATVPADTLAKIKTLARQVLAKADSLPREIETGIADYSETVIRIGGSGDTITFRGTTQFAEEVDALREYLVRVVDVLSFTRDTAAAAPPPNRLKIVLESADQIQVVQEDYFRQRFRVVEMSSPSPPTFIVSFDPYTMSAEEMVASIKQNKFVRSVTVVGAMDTEPSIAD